jgi:hypothetical protein
MIARHKAIQGGGTSFPKQSYLVEIWLSARYDGPMNQADYIHVTAARNSMVHWVAWHIFHLTDMVASEFDDLQFNTDYG